MKNRQDMIDSKKTWMPIERAIWETDWLLADRPTQIKMENEKPEWAPTTYNFD